jgi:hypothetical protein
VPLFVADGIKAVVCWENAGKAKKLALTAAMRKLLGHPQRHPQGSPTMARTTLHLTNQDSR